MRLGHLLKVLTHLGPGLVQGYDIEGFPGTNNEMERTIRAIKMHSRRIRGRKNWNPIDVKLRMVEFNTQVTTNDSCEKIERKICLLSLLKGVNQ